MLNILKFICIKGKSDFIDIYTSSQTYYELNLKFGILVPISMYITTKKLYSNFNP